MKTIKLPFDASILLGRRSDDPIVVEFVSRHGGSTHTDVRNKVGQIAFNDKGFDIVLGFVNEQFHVHNIRFFSPGYCTGKPITPFQDDVIDGLRFPLERQNVRRQLGSPDREVRNMRNLDEYDFSDCCLQFVSPKNQDIVSFVAVQPLPHGTTSEIGVAVKQRVAQLDETVRSTWLIRYDAYKSLFGEALTVLPGTKESGPGPIDVLVFKCADGYAALTSGMSDHVIPGADESERRAELEMFVRTLRPEFITRLKQDAAFPFADHCTLGHGDTIAWDIALADQSNLRSDLLVYSPYKAHREVGLRIEGDIVTLLCCIPITREELEFKKTHGIQKLLDAFDAAKLDLFVDPKRKSVI